MSGCQWLPGNITQNPSVFVTGCLHGIRKNIFMFTLSEPSAFRIRCTFLDRFSSFPSELPPQEGGSLGSSFFSFRGFFPCASRSSLISFFNCSSKNSASSSAIRFRIFFAVCPCFYMGGIHEDLGRINQSVFIAFLQDTGKDLFKRSASGIILSKRREMGNLVHHFQTEEPSVCDIDFDFFYCLAHASDAVQILDEWNFNEHDRIHLWGGHCLHCIYRSQDHR